MRVFRIWLFLCFGAVLAVMQPVAAGNPVFGGRVEGLFAPEHDLLAVKLAVDSMLDPSSNPQLVAAEIGRIVADIEIMAGHGAEPSEKLIALKRYLYESGAWNGNWPFQYDLSDPLGEKPVNRLLQRYLTTRRGNCITMPLLFVALGQRLGLTMTLAEAPLHVLVKYTDDEGRIWNLEATSGGGFTRDVWYRQKLPMSDQAVANGVYLRPLSHDETTALIASSLVERQIEMGAFEDAIAVSDVLLHHHPNFAYGLVKKGSAYSGLLRRELAGKYTRVDEIPADLKVQAAAWYAANMNAFAKAEALGWRPEDGQTQ
ncbi:regulator of sirC expression with transglutaminase-like and TPR domain [Pararhizobium capsulatum DSM 1112]|uniref:Regulator of sirC expression with transglutaminase-like and TPR domain n=1 Tax=Pararhizobium capsulatum DSM 1112 TaxID=1121113 RepID=A0ABU0BI83_9HYPH|nr:transglutaminase family protein [Pararhizobium capsulatum]MDQ0317914.1 regulator of sirC expression with transglutaminase-like and TPR domain [Pararhizobium capsulatum DSM 1112]